MSERIERDFAGHFIAASSCRFYRTTDVGGWRISTVGDYHPECPPSMPKHLAWNEDVPQEVGLNRLYETMVFPLGDKLCGCGCGAPEVSNWSERDFAGYNSEASAIAGHEAMVEKWAATPTPGGPDGR